MSNPAPAAAVLPAPRRLRLRPAKTAQRKLTLVAVAALVCDAEAWACDLERRLEVESDPQVAATLRLFIAGARGGL